MAKKSAKKNRFTKWRKTIASTIKRTGRGLKRGARLAWKMAKTAERSVRDVTVAISRAAHRNDSTALTKTEQFEIKLNDADCERRRQAKKDDATRLEHIRNDRELQRLRINGILDHTANGKAKEWHEYQAEQLARQAQRTAATSTQVTAHVRRGSEGVKAHSRKLTPKQKQQALNDQILKQKQ